MKIEDFLEARWLEAENKAAQKIPSDPGGAYLGVVALHTQLRMVLDFHKQWPVLVQKPAQFDMTSDGVDTNTMTYRFVQEMHWLTQQAYVERFGEDPPTAPLLRQMVQAYTYHPDFQEEWLL